MSTVTKPDEWIGVAEVAAELHLTERAAWELVRRLKVPMIEAGRAVMARARFRRTDWEACRDGSMKPAAQRQAKPLPPSTKAKPDLAAKRARLRG